jgi:hypothetical protein
MRLDRPGFVVLSLLLVVGCGEGAGPASSTTAEASPVEAAAGRPTGQTVSLGRGVGEESPQAVAATDLHRKADPVYHASFPGIALGRGPRGTVWRTFGPAPTKATRAKSSRRGRDTRLAIAGFHDTVSKN